MSEITKPKRQRAPSKRSLQTRARIFDAAELIFAHRGFEGASIRDIAEAANVQKALVSFHGGSKEGLFAKVVERRAQQLSYERLDALNALPEHALLAQILESFIRPLLEKATPQMPQWLAYVHLIAQVSADPRWHDIAMTCFDPTAKKFIAAIAQLYPNSSPQAVATCFVFTVSAMLSLCTSQWRIDALGDAQNPPSQQALLDDLIGFCEAGIHRVLK